MTGIVQLKVKSLKLQDYIIYYNFSFLRTNLFYKLTRQEIKRKYYYAYPPPLQPQPLPTTLLSIHVLLHVIVLS